MNNDLIYQVAITRIPGVGGVTARRLISYCGGVEHVFRQSYKSLVKIPGVGEQIARTVIAHRSLDRAEQEIVFMEKHGIRPLFYLDKDYPYRLKQCDDGPLLIFMKGNADLNAQKMVAIVGTRNITEYGRERCEQLIQDLVPYQATIVSGLAYGVDACAHYAAVKSGLPTIAVLGHGLDRIYPQMHYKLARRMLDNGALITDFLTGTKPDRENFPKRNRIIAGLCDAVIVIEAAISGGALITANIANTYNRDVFALPGKVTDKYSQGCNKLIKINKAHLIESVADMEYIMNWHPDGNREKGVQANLFVNLDNEEKIMVDFLKEKQESGIDQIVAGTGFNLSKTSSILLGLEFKGVVKPLPGKAFKLSGKIL